MTATQAHRVAVIDAGVDSLDEAQVDEMPAARAEEERRIDASLERRERGPNQRTVRAEVDARVVALALEKDNLPHGHDPAAIAVAEKHTIGRRP